MKIISLLANCYARSLTTRIQNLFTKFTFFILSSEGNKEILHNVSGKFSGSQLIAIMGPSGAGKSTLLDALSGFKTTGVDGSILLNGRRRDLRKCLQLFIIIPIINVLLQLLSGECPAILPRMIVYNPC